MQMGCRGCFVEMATEAIDHGVVGGFDDHQYSGAGWCGRVDVAAGVVAGGATTEMGGQDIWPIQGRVTVGARLGV